MAFDPSWCTMTAKDMTEVKNMYDHLSTKEIAVLKENEKGEHPYLVEMNRLLKTNYTFTMKDVHEWYMLLCNDPEETKRNFILSNVTHKAWIDYCVRMVNSNRDDLVFFK